MPVTFPAVRVGQPLRYQSLAVFPLFTPQTTPLDYWLSDEGIGRGTVTVEEVSETGSVPELMVENKGDVRPGPRLRPDAGQRADPRERAGGGVKGVWRDCRALGSHRHLLRPPYSHTCSGPGNAAWRTSSR